MAQRPPAGCASGSTEAAQTRSAAGKEVGGLRQHAAGEQEAAEAGPALTGSVEVLRQAGQVQGRQQGAAHLGHQAVHGAGYNGQSPRAAAIFDPGRGGAALTPASGPGSS